MTATARLLPGQSVPPLAVETLDGELWQLSEQQPRNFSLIVVYRGLHCPICKGYLGDLAQHHPAFMDQGVEVIALSTDDEPRARKAQSEWDLGALTIGYDLDLETAQRWGLFLSSGISEKEPPLFVEPGLFLVRPDGTLYCASIQTMPFARPKFADVLKAVEFVLARNYPARGSATYPVAQTQQ